MTSLLAPYTSIARRSVNEDHDSAVHGKDVTVVVTTQKASSNIVVVGQAIDFGQTTENPQTVARASATVNCRTHVSLARSAPTRTTTPTANLALTPLPTSILNETRSSISKIPSPLGTVLSVNKRSRSASVRMRGTKSNLHHETRSYSNAGGTVTTINKMDMEQASDSSTHIAAASGVGCEVGVSSGNGINAYDTNDAGGQISARRKVVLNSQKVSSPAILTRSLSLRRYQTKLNDNNKTDNDKETASCSAAVTAAPQTNEQSGNPSTPRQEHSTSLGNPDSVDHHSGYHVSEVHKDMTGQSDMADAVQGGSSKLLNGATEKITTTPATRPTTLATTTAAAAGAAEANPEATKPESGTAITTTSITVKAPKTPRAPTTTAPLVQTSSQAQRHSHPHTQVQSLSIHRGCCRRSPSDRQTPLYSVPEATTTTTTKLTPCTPPVTPDSPSTFLDDDLDSMYSFATTTSGRSTMSCDHPYVARNGTTFSGRKMKYVVHCSNYAGQVGPDYLTPTQRAARQVRRLKELLCAARHDLEQKDSELLRLTREVVELRLFKASLSSPEERSASSDAVTVREAELKTSQDVSPIVDMVDDGSKSSPRHIVGVTNHNHHHNHSQHHPHQYQSQQQHSSEMQSSFADSGHFEDLTSSSVNSKDDSYSAHTHDIACGSDEAAGGDAAASYELQRQELIRVYEERIEELIRNQDANATEVKRSHNDKVEALLQKLAECNTRYADIVPDYEHAKERIRELEKHLEELQRKLAENEDKQNKMYLHMYQQGQEAERIARADQALELAHRAPNNKVSLNELLHQLQSTQDELENIRTIYRRLLEAQKNRTHVDPEITLQFLKSAVYYFLTDKENSQGHLQAIESILEFTEVEKQNINRARSAK